MDLKNVDSDYKIHCLHLLTTFPLSTFLDLELLLLIEL